MEKNAKNKKKNAVLFKIFYLISPQWEHFGTYFKQIQEATVQGYNFHFLRFLDIGHVTNNPTAHYMNPDRYNHSHLVFLHYLVKLSEISFLGYMHRTLTWILKAMPHCTYMICIPIFFLIFMIFFFISNTQISSFGHVPWTLQTPANNTDYHSYFFHHFSSIF